jgi:HAD superfamily hydrolase (TIGR01509 family)
MKHFKAIIFDMDGVLVDSEPYHVEIEKRMFKKMKLEVSDKEHAGYMGTATDVMWKQIIKKRKLSLDVDEMTKLTNNEGIKLFSALETIEPMTGLIDLLEQIQERKIPMAVASSSDPETIKIIMEKSGLQKYFKHTVSSKLVGKSKPSPDVFLYASKLLKAIPEECLVIEDSKNGIKAAKSAGMFCVAYSGVSGENQDQKSADLVIDDFNTLADILIKCCF